MEKKPLRILLELLECALGFGDNEEVESAANELLACVKNDLFTLTWAENGKYETFESTYPESIEGRLHQVPYDSKVVRLSRSCGHCGNRESIAHSSGTTSENVKWVLQRLQEAKER